MRGQTLATGLPCRMAIMDDFDYSERAQAAERAKLGLYHTIGARGFPGDPGWTRWENAAQTVHDAIGAAYPPGFWDAYLQVKAKDPAGLEHAVRFLEADPWFHRSGYIKSALLRYLRRIVLPDAYRERLQQVILAVVRRRDGREFIDYCRLARRLDTAAFRAILRELSTYPDPAVRRRAGWVEYVVVHEGRQQPESGPIWSPGLEDAYHQLEGGDATGVEANRPTIACPISARKASESICANKGAYCRQVSFQRRRPSESSTTTCRRRSCSGSS